MAPCGDAVAYVGVIGAYAESRVIPGNDGLRPLGLAGAVLGGLAQLNATSVAYTRSYAGFWDGTFAITSADNITFGARYTDDRIINRSNDEFITTDGTSSVLSFPTQYTSSRRPPRGRPGASERCLPDRVLAGPKLAR